MNSEQRKEIQELVEILNEQNLTEIEVERGDSRIRIRRESAAVVNAPSVPDILPAMESGQALETLADSVERDSSRLLTVTSPVVGTFYRSSSPDTDPYAEEGDLVSKGQVLGIVEAMKLMNEIESEVDGRLVKVLVENEFGVEYGQPLFVIDPLS